jgi:hypothetical protein
MYAQITDALNSIPKSFRQGHRLVQFLTEHPSACTVEIAQGCAIGNISDVARRVNPYLYRHGLFVSCRRPSVPIPNRFGEPSDMFEWSLHQVREEQAA